MPCEIVSFTPIKLNNQRLPGKNTMKLNRIPLCNYLFDTLKKVSEIDRKYVYCSSEAIKEYLPMELTFLKRDVCLDGPRVRGLAIIESFVREVDADIYVLAHVTQPFTQPSSLKRALGMVANGPYDSSFSAVKLQDYCWFEGKPINYRLEDIPLTQQLEPVIMETGAFFIFRKEVFLNYRQRIGKNPYICYVDEFEAIDIDTIEDFRFASAAAKYLETDGARL